MQRRQHIHANCVCIFSLVEQFKRSANQFDILSNNFPFNWLFSLPLESRLVLVKNDVNKCVDLWIVHSNFGFKRKICWLSIKFRLICEKKRVDCLNDIYTCSLKLRKPKRMSTAQWQTDIPKSISLSGPGFVFSSPLLSLVVRIFYCAPSIFHSQELSVGYLFIVFWFY